MNKDQIKKLRESLGMTQGEFAGGLHVSQQLVNFWERGIEPSPYHYLLLQKLMTAVTDPLRKQKIIQAMHNARKLRAEKENAKALMALGVVMALALALPDEPKMAKKKKIAYMCGVAWQHDVGQGSGYIKIFATAEECEKGMKCAKSCGIVQVEIREVRWPKKQDLKGPF